MLREEGVRGGSWGVGVWVGGAKLCRWARSCQGCVATSARGQQVLPSLFIRLCHREPLHGPGKRVAGQ